MSTLYETDFYGWTQRQAELLRLEEFAEVDWNNLIEEIKGLGRNQQNGALTVELSCCMSLCHGADFG